MSPKPRSANLAHPVIIADASSIGLLFGGEGYLIAHPVKHAECLAEEVAGAELGMVLGQGHIYNFAVPELVAAALSELADPARVPVAPPLLAAWRLAPSLAAKARPNAR